MYRDFVNSGLLLLCILLVAGCGGSASDSQVKGQLAIGDMAPDFVVEALGGETIKFSNFVNESSGPTILLFDRAHW